MASLRRVIGLVMVAALFVGAAAAGCGNTGDDSGFGQPGDDQEGGTGTPPPGFVTGDGSSGGMDAIDTDALGVLVVTPPTATIPITIVNGVVTVNAPVQFTATYNGSKVAAQWLFDRGELGDVDTSGLFTASGTNVGKGTLTARFGAREGTAPITVTIASKENGATAGADAGADAGFGGLGGVGGEPLGGAVSPTIQSRLETESTAPASAAELGYLYPYDKTIWPRGLLAPLVMYQTTHDPDAVYVKLSQGNYSFEGVYSLAAQPSGSDARKRVRIEDAVWLAATNGNQGDDLQIDVKVHTADDDKVYGPITEKWKVASGILKGTVYYNSYDSALTGGAAGTTGGVISIKPRSPSPTLAVPANAGKCNVCHTVSADGSTLWAQDANYTDGASYDLKNSAARTPYLKSSDPANDHKFVWSAPYPDGSFALVSSRYAREAYLQNDAKLFARGNGTEVASTYGAGALSATVQSAVTPAFSPDGKKVVFNFWEGTGAGGVAAGAGRSLAIMDFDCGAAAGSVACAGAVDGGPGTGAHTFSNLREIYKDATRFPAWPSFLPDGKAVVFHDTVQRGSCGPNPADRTSPYNCQISTWYSAES
ncbi:MAG TPA: hypothetical protein VIF62_12475, partial [Labilithrix sp.]